MTHQGEPVEHGFTPATSARGSSTRQQRQFRFGVQCSSPPSVSSRSWTELAQKCEDLGFARLTVADHLDEQLAPIAALMAAADATTDLRVGAMVFCNDYRHPVVLAKEAATLDVLSDGRFDLGLGAGWMTSDYQRSGIPHEPAAVRIERLEESIQVMEALFSGEPVNHQGRHYHLDAMAGSPRPVQQPRPPLLVGGGGRRVLEVAARHADIVGLNPVLAAGVIDASMGQSATAAATDRKIGWIREAAGDRFDQIELQTRIHMVLVTEERKSVAEELAGGFGISPAEALESPHALVGTTYQIVDDLLERRERFGISSVGVSLDSLDDMAPVIEELAGR